MSAEKGFSRHISFARLKDLVEPSKGNDDTQGSPGMEREGMGEIVYVCNATRLRHLFLFRFGDENLDVSGRIKEDDDTCMTYRGYIRFLATDLLNVYPTGPRRSKSQYKKGVEYIAKQMLSRGDVSCIPLIFSFLLYLTPQVLGVLPTLITLFRRYLVPLADINPWTGICTRSETELCRPAATFNTPVDI